MKCPEPAIWFPAIRCNTGADVFTERLCNALNHRGFRAEIHWLPHRAEYAPWLVPRSDAPKWANVIHANSWIPSRLLPNDLPRVVTVHHCVHDPEFAPYRGFLQSIYHRTWIRKVESRNLAHAEVVTSVSRYTAQKTKAAFGPRSITIIHNSIDSAGPFLPIAKRQPAHPFKLLYVGKWSRRKAADLLAPIMESLGDRFVLQYTGDNGRGTERFRIPPNSQFLGAPADSTALADVYRNADALLFPSRLEGFGLVALEAQACGLPVVAARSSALPEIVKHGVTGLLCPIDDVAAFADAIRRLAGDPELWSKLSAFGPEHAKNTFNEDKLIQDYLEVYRSAIKVSES